MTITRPPSGGRGAFGIRLFGVLRRRCAADQRISHRPDGLGQDRRRAAAGARAQLPFHDSDAEIERRTGVDIPFIFEKEGEAGFRQREREAIEALTGARAHRARHRRRRGAAAGEPPAPGRTRLRGVPRDLGGAAGRPRAPRAQPPAARAAGRFARAARRAHGRARAAVRARSPISSSRPTGGACAAWPSRCCASSPRRPGRAERGALPGLTYTARRAARHDASPGDARTWKLLKVELGTRSYPILIGERDCSVAPGRCCGRICRRATC